MIIQICYKKELDLNHEILFPTKKPSLHWSNGIFCKMVAISHMWVFEHFKYG